jgi:hypothetical protein
VDQHNARVGPQRHYRLFAFGSCGADRAQHGQANTSGGSMIEI